MDRYLLRPQVWKDAPWMQEGMQRKTLQLQARQRAWPASLFQLISNLDQGLSSSGHCCAELLGTGTTRLLLLPISYLLETEYSYQSSLAWNLAALELVAILLSPALSAAGITGMNHCNGSPPVLFLYECHCFPNEEWCQSYHSKNGKCHFNHNQLWSTVLWL